MHRKCLLPATALALTLAASSVCQTLPAGVQKKASVGGITEYQYPNGLRVLLYPDPANPKVTINMTYLVGSRHEGYGETGMAHLLEHMDFIETTSGRQIKNEIVAHGAAWNGTTSDDRTNYFETVTASDENLKWALGLEADRMVNVKMSKELLDTEMTVVRNEFERGENSPQRVLQERVAATAFLWHNYGKSTIGSREDIEKVPIDRLAAFYRKYYQPDNAVLVIAGKLDESKTLQYVADTCGKIARPTRKLDQTYTVEPVQDGQRYVELRRVGEGQEIIMAYHVPAAGHPDSAALQVISGIMTGGGGGRGGRGGGGGPATGRLTKALVDNKLANSASMRSEQLHDPGLVQISASLSRDQSIDVARKAMAETLAGLITEPPSKEEVERVKNRLLRNMEDRFQADPQQIGLGLTTPISQGDWRLMFLEYDRVKAVTPEDLVRVARNYFKESNLTVGVFVPTAAPDRSVVPATPDLSSLFTNFKSSVVVSRAEEFDPTPANIEKRLVRSRLANGMRVVLLPKKMAGGTVSVAIELHFGDGSMLAGRNAAAQLAGGLLMSGTRSKTRQQIQDEMEKLNARITVSGGGGFGGRGGGRGGPIGGGGGVSGASATITARPENLAAAMRLAVEMLRDPGYPDTEFERMKTQRLRALENPPTQPEQLAAQELQRHLSPFANGDAQYSPTREEQIEQLKIVTVAEVKKFHDEFYGASHGELVVIGEVDQVAFKQLAAELLGAWTTPAPYARLSSSFKNVEAINKRIETPDKENAQFEAGLRIRMPESHPDYPAMILANYMFGGSITARVPDRIRNKEGLSYGASSRFTAPTDGDAALFSATVSSNPANTPKVEASFMDELKKTLAGGFTAAEVAEAKKAYQDSRKVGRSQEGALLGLIASHEHLGRTMLYDEQLEAKIQALSVDQINAAFRKHVDPAAVTIVKAGDFKKVGVYQ